MTDQAAPAVESKTVVLTAENAAAFYAKKLDLAPPAAEVVAAAPAVTEEAPPAEEAAPETKKPAEKEIPKKNQRYMELVQERKDAESAAAAALARAEAAEARAKELEGRQAKPEAPAVDADKPKPEDFEDAFEYAEKLAEYTANKAITARDKAAAEAAAKAANERRAADWAAKQAKVVEKIPDWQEVIDASPVKVHNAVRDAIVESDVGHELLYHLAKNPSEAERLGKLSVISALRELGKIEAKLDAPKPRQETKEPEAEISHAPAPISPLKGGKVPAEVPLNSKGEFTGTPAQWKAMRRAGLIH